MDGLYYWKKIKVRVPTGRHQLINAHKYIIMCNVHMAYYDHVHTQLHTRMIVTQHEY